MTKTPTGLIEAAQNAIRMSHAPYSKHPVGAALLADDGEIYAGCNIENAAYPLSSCAENTAIGAMVMGGALKIKAVVIVGPSTDVCAPCGGCRQKLREFTGGDDVPVTICARSGEVLLETSMHELLPHAFGPENLESVKP